MKEVLRFVEMRVADGRQHPFIMWLDNDKIPAKDRLTRWLQTAAIFVFGFKDIHSMVLPYPQSEANTDEIKHAINAHAEEDSNHWAWYLSDLKKLDLDQTQTFTESLRYLWSEQTSMQRFATYRLCQLIDRAQDPVIRYCIVKAIEAFGEIIFQTTTRVSKELLNETGIKLDYLGEIHSERESGGLQKDVSQVEKKISAIELDFTKRKQCVELADETCTIIENRWHEFYKQSLIS